ncbi:class I SAM-dependent methyltransferase [Cesiribacter sp. SM1]|uniref:class I SAM-dependent methyltransferase n=1 Tax=Cesiribacter sp. SM1 TaxID=2861196 RepID=UPI001CD4A89D|nr:class I SAM-dependent methyltransferase [Cesiribacter sp. SM1]
MVKNIISWVIRKVPRRHLQLFSHHVLKVAAILYRGNGVNCPVCNHNFRKFLPYGRKARENALCPNCLALERHRLMYLFLQRKTPFFTKPLKVLHIAPELCFIHRFEQQKNLDYVTADIESPLAKVKMDVHQIPFEEATFDVVFCNHVLEHVTSDLQAMREMHRVLKPGGWGIMQIPLFHPLPEVTYEDFSVTTPAEREKAFGQDDHVRLFGKDYPDRLRSAGFKVTEDWLARELPPEEQQRYALPQEPVYFVQKV